LKDKRRKLKSCLREWDWMKLKIDLKRWRSRKPTKEEKSRRAKLSEIKSMTRKDA